jgi:hypothetical protein
MISMVKKCLVPFAKVIKPGFSIGGFNEAVLGTLPIARKEEITFPAKPGQGIPFVLPELSLFFRDCESGHGGLQDVSQEVLRLDEVVTGIQIAIVLQSHAQTAGSPENADGSCPTKPARQSSIKIEYKRQSDITLNPIVKNLY